VSTILGTLIFRVVEFPITECGGADKGRDCAVPIGKALRIDRTVTLSRAGTAIHSVLTPRGTRGDGEKGFAQSQDKQENRKSPHFFLPRMQNLLNPSLCKKCSPNNLALRWFSLPWLHEVRIGHWLKG